MIDDERFYAWLDGELGGDEGVRVAQAVASSPELSARAEQHRRLSKDLRGAFDPLLDAGPPAPKFGAQVIDFRSEAGARSSRFTWRAPQWAAMAASLAIGLVLGSQLTSAGPDSPVSVEGGRLMAAAALDQALDKQLASAAVSDGERIGLTFRDSAGRICRSFSDAQASGLACRDGDGWAVKGLFPAAEGQRGDYRMAAGEDPRLAALIDQTIQGEPFDAAQERAAMEQGWR